jgi:hypothetical protein
MLLDNIIDTKIVDHKAEGNGTGDVHEEARGVGQLDIAIFGKVEDQVIIGQDAGLWKAIHAFVDFSVDKTIFG